MMPPRCRPTKVAQGDPPPPSFRGPAATCADGGAQWAFADAVSKWVSTQLGMLEAGRQSGTEDKSRLGQCARALGEQWMNQKGQGNQPSQYHCMAAARALGAQVAARTEPLYADSSCHVGGGRNNGSRADPQPSASGRGGNGSRTGSQRDSGRHRASPNPPRTETHRSSSSSSPRGPQRSSSASAASARAQAQAAGVRREQAAEKSRQENFVAAERRKRKAAAHAARHERFIAERARKVRAEQAAAATEAAAKDAAKATTKAAAAKATRDAGAAQPRGAQTPSKPVRGRRRTRKPPPSTKGGHHRDRR